MATSDQAFEAQEEEEFVEILPDGTVVPVQPNQPPRGAALRDPKGEY